MREPSGMRRTCISRSQPDSSQQFLESLHRREPCHTRAGKTKEQSTPRRFRDPNRACSPAFPESFAVRQLPLLAQGENGLSRRTLQESPYLSSAFTVGTHLVKKPMMQGCLRYLDRLCSPPLGFARYRQVPSQSCDQLRALLVRGIIPRGSIPHRSD